MPLDPELYLEKRSHHFRVFNFTLNAKKIIEDYARTLVHWGYIREGRRSRRAPLKVFAASNFNRDEYRFHIHSYNDFISFLKERHINQDRINTSVIDLQPPNEVLLPIKDGWSPRDYQEPVIDYIANPNGPRQRLVLLQTGLGKSAISMFAASRLKHRFVLVARPMYLDKWVLDIKKTYDIPEDDILVIRGGTSLMGLIERAKTNQLTEKVILLSNKTLQIYINNFERYGEGLLDMGYDATPDTLFQLLGGGIRVIDEVHQDFHANFKLDLYTHTERSVSLTATLLTDDAFIKRMHELAYPIKDRYVGEDAKPYINSIALLYQFRESKKIRYTDFSGKTYSHHVFEQSVIRHKEILTNYLKMILDMINIYFVNNKDRKEGDKFIVFCASIDLCTRVTDYLNQNLKGIEVLRYVEDDPYSNLMEPIGRVSTLLSAGTAVDIDRLFCTFLTTAVNSSPSNVQGFGRLRQMKDGRNPLFIYFNDMNNPKHLDYHEKKKEIIKPRSKNFKEINYGSLI